MSEILTKFLNNAILRNLSVTILDFIIIAGVFYTTYIIFITPLKSINWWLVISAYLISFLFRLLSLRLRVTRVCPQCNENRAIRYSTVLTGNTANYRSYIEGDYWMYSQDEEYLEKRLCVYCGYTTENLYWQERVWRGDLTEEAKQRKQEEANERMIKQYKQAMLDVQEMRHRRY